MLKRFMWQSYSLFILNSSLHSPSGGLGASIKQQGAVGRLAVGLQADAGLLAVVEEDDYNNLHLLNHHLLAFADVDAVRQVTSVG